jgi:hypothetical protein
LFFWSKKHHKNTSNHCLKQAKVSENPNVSQAGQVGASLSLFFSSAPLAVAASLLLAARRPNAHRRAWCPPLGHHHLPFPPHSLLRSLFPVLLGLSQLQCGLSTTVHCELACRACSAAVAEPLPSGCTAPSATPFHTLRASHSIHFPITFSGGWEHVVRKEKVMGLFPTALEIYLCLSTYLEVGWYGGCAVSFTFCLPFPASLKQGCYRIYMHSSTSDLQTRIHQ